MRAQTTSRRDFLKAATATVGAGALAVTGLEAGVKTAAAAVPAVRAAAIEPSGVIWGLLYQPHVAAYHRMADVFKKQTGSTLTVQPQPWPLDAKIIAAIAGGVQPDACCILGNQTLGLAIQGAVVPIQDSVFKANHINIARDWVGDSVDQFSWRGKIYGVPIESDGGVGGVVNVPADDLKKLGVASQYPPFNGKWWFESYDDLFKLAKELQVVKNGRVVRYGLCGEGWDDYSYMSIMLTMGVKPFDEEHKRFNFNTEAGIRAFELHAEIPHKMGIEKEWGDGQAVINTAITGRAALTLANAVPVISGPALGYNYVPAGIPKIDGRTPQIIGEGGGWGFVGPAHAQHPGIQTAFLRMMTTQAGQYAYDNGSILNPVLKSTLSDKSTFTGPPPSGLTQTVWHALWVFENALRNITPNTTYIGEVGYIPKIGAAINAMSGAIREGKMTSKQAAAQVQSQAVAQYKQYLIDVANSH